MTAGGNPIPPPNTLRENVIGSTEYRSENLLNEKITSREIVYLGEFLSSTLLFNARLFNDDVSNYIDTVREEDTNFEANEIPFDDVVHVFRNPIESSATGLELELDYYIDPSLRLIASGAIINITSNNSGAVKLSAPQHSYSLFVTKQFNKKYNGSLGYYFVENFNWMDSSGTGDYRTLDLRFSRNFNFNRTHGSLSLVVKNLLDDYSDYKENPRNDTAPKIIQNTTAYIDFRLNF